MKLNLVRSSAVDLTLDIVNYVFTFLFMLLCLYPFYYVIINSLTPPRLAVQGVFLLPPEIDLSTYSRILSDPSIGRAFFISISRTVVGTVLCVLLTSMFAHLVTKREMPLRKLIYRLVIVTMYINAGLIPWYLTLRAYGLRNNFLVYILPTAVNAFYLILVKTYIEQLPASLEESAHMDGAGFLTIFFRIILPLSSPIVATIAVFNAVMQWNMWRDNFFLVSDRQLQTVQLILYRYLTNAQSIAETFRTGGGRLSADQRLDITPQSVQMVTIVVTVLPILLVYPFLQRYFAKGILVGAIKG